jgi:hypothetical protein
MGWILSVVIGCVSGGLGLVAAGLAAESAVGWYRVSSFEGGSGFFVIGMALLGLLGGFIVGLVTARVVAGRPRPGFVKGAGTAALAVVAIVGAIAGTARLLADVPPRLDGEELHLVVEFRWPASGTPLPDRDGVGLVRLGAASAQVVRTSRDGPLFLDAAHLEDGRWVVSGAAPIFTSRGSRVLNLVIGGDPVAGFIVPLGGHPGPASQEWSEWMPTAAPGAPLLPDQFTYRFRVIRTSEPLRTDRVGPFEIDTVASGFFSVGDSDRLAADARFRIRTAGEVLAPGTEFTGVVVAGPGAAALVAETRDGCRFIRAEPLAIEPLEACGLLREARPLTNEAARFAEGRRFDVVPGWIDRRTMREPGMYRMGAVVVDTRALTATAFSTPDGHSVVSSVPPLAVAPDERRFAWFAHGHGAGAPPALIVTDWRTSASEILPIDPVRMRYPAEDALTPDWVAHHFEWIAEDGGELHLREREDFVPLPYRGTLTLGDPGAYQSYSVQPGSEALRAALVAALVEGMQAERLPDELDGYQQRVRVLSEVLSITVGESPSYVSVSTFSGTPEMMKAVAFALDAALATGRFDELFVHPRPGASQ